MSEREKTWPISTDLIEKGETVTGERAVAQANAWLLDGNGAIEASRSKYRSCRMVEYATYNECATCHDVTGKYYDEDEAPAVSS